MRILAAHTYYRERGGEDESFEAETALLERSGHEVIRFTRHNADLAGATPVANAIRTVWNRSDVRALRDLVRRVRPDVAHVNNTFPAMSPAVFGVLADEGVPNVHALRNYRLVCSNALLYRDGRPCDDCVGVRFGWPGIRHRCYRDSRLASTVTAAMLATHRALGVWPEKVDHFITLSRFQRDQLVRGGLDPHRTSVKPNFVHPDRGPGSGDGGFVLFVGRLSPEKGVATVLDAWTRPEPAPLPLRIVGDGPMAARVANAAERSREIEWLGRRTREEVDELLGSATTVVFASEWYEPFGRVIAEAFARGTPVVAAARGAPPEMVDHGMTGLHFAPGDAELLREAIDRLAGLSADEYATMRRHARRAFEERYTADRNLDLLLEVYERARRHASRTTADTDRS